MTTVTLASSRCLFRQCPNPGAPLELSDCVFTQPVYKKGKRAGQPTSNWIVKGVHKPCGHIVTKFISAAAVPGQPVPCVDASPDSETLPSEPEIQPLI